MEFKINLTKEQEKALLKELQDSKSIYEKLDDLFYAIRTTYGVEYIFKLVDKLNQMPLNKIKEFIEKE